MKDKERPEPHIGAWYSALYMNLVHIARGCGYALAVHGSVSRDLDLIAVPWTWNAKSCERLVKAFEAATGCKAQENKNPDHQKPHGRRVFILSFYNQGYIDLGVIRRDCDWIKELCQTKN